MRQKSGPAQAPAEQVLNGLSVVLWLGYFYAFFSCADQGARCVI